MTASRKILPEVGPVQKIAFATLISTVGDGAFATCSTIFFVRLIRMPLDEFSIGLTAAGVAGVVAGVPFGHLADLKGPRRITVLLMFLTGLVTLTIGYATSFILFLVIFSAYSLLSRGGIAARQALIAQSLSGVELIKARARLRALSHVGISAGAGIGTAVLTIGSMIAYRAAFALDGLSFFLAATALLGNVTAKEPMKTQHGKPVRPGKKRVSVFTDGPYVLISVISMVTALQFSLLDVALPLWIYERTSAPHVMVAILIIVNTVGVALLQVRLSRKITTPESATRSFVLSGILLFLACAVLACSAAVPPTVAVVILVTAGLIHLYAEIIQSASTWVISFDFASAGHQGQYQGLFNSGAAGARVFGPALYTTLVIGIGGPGWLVLGGLFAGAGCAMLPAIKWAKQQAFHERLPTNITTLGREAVVPKQGLLIVDGKAEHLKTISQLDVNIINVLRPGQADSRIADLAFITIASDYERRAELSTVAKALHRAGLFSAAIALTEGGLLPVARLNEDLGLTGTSTRTVALLTDKWKMRKLLNESGISTVTARIGRTESDIVQFAKDLGREFIIKPIAGSSSYGIFKVADPVHDVSLAWNRMTEIGLSVFLMEEYLDGREISVECFSFHGRHVPLAFAQTWLSPTFVEMGHIMPADLTPQEEESIAAVVGEFLDAVGLREGPSHIEVKLTPDGPKVLEGHNRRGGGRLNTLTRLVYGIDLERMTAAWPLGLAEELRGRPAAFGAGVVRFFEALPGRVREIRETADEGLLGDRAEYHVNFKLGDIVQPLRWSLDRAGYVVVHRATAQAAQRAAQGYADGLEIIVDPVLDQDGERLEARHLLHQLDQIAALGYEPHPTAPPR